MSWLSDLGDSISSGWNNYFSGNWLNNSWYGTTWNGIYDWVTGAKAADVNADASKELYDYQIANTSNAIKANYNALKSVGINPLLSYGNGAGSTSMPTMTSASSAHSGSIGDIMSMFSWCTSAMKVATEIANTKANTDLAKANTAKVAKEIGKIERQTEYPGVVGEAFQSFKNIGKEIGEPIGDTIGSALGTIGQAIGDTASSHSALNQKRVDDLARKIIGTAEKAKDATEKADKKINARMQRETHQYSPKTSKRKHN